MKIGTCPWLTPTVLAIAQSAYSERPGRKCEKCEGEKFVWDEAYPGDGTKRICPTCHGTGRIEDGTLDSVTLAILADALEDAGCNVGAVHKYNDGGTAFWYNDAFGKECPHLTPDRAAQHPILAHLRSPGPHVRGCWALDLILGKE